MSRVITKSLLGKIEKNSIRLNDFIELFPVEGRRKRINLKRSKLILSNQIDLLENEGDVLLETLNDEVLNYELKLSARNKMGDISETTGRFILKSLNNTPFKINGQYSFESLIEAKDRIYLGYNLITPFQETNDTENFLVHPILKDEVFLKSRLTLAIEGETGTGKSHLAKLVHEKSRRVGPFVQVNISSFSEGLIESELFGHVKGAFTSAFNDKVGAFKEASGGTLFIDEIDSLPLNIQTKLLLFLDNSKVRPVGGRSEQICDVRLVVASGRRLQNLVEGKQMRSDFYFRITSGEVIVLPSLRDQNERIEALINDFSVKNTVNLTYKLVEFYKTLPWPGNIRQLLGHLEKKKMLSRSKKIDFDSLDEKLIIQSTDLQCIQRETKVFRSLIDIKKSYAKNVYFYFDQNTNMAAQKLGISNKTLRELMK